MCVSLGMKFLKVLSTAMIAFDQMDQALQSFH